jgi:ribosomal protein S18 acetylase RimI-like enzyme
MPISIRRADFPDLLALQNANLHSLGENYDMWYWLYLLLSAPQVSHLATANGKVLGYVLGKVDNDSAHAKPPLPLHGVITSVAVYKRCRKLGLGAKLMATTHKLFETCFGAEYVQLHVRETNKAGRHLYTETLGYQFVCMDEKYYADGENALRMKVPLPRSPS